MVFVLKPNFSSDKPRQISFKITEKLADASDITAKEENRNLRKLIGELKAELNIAQTDLENYKRRELVGGHSERNDLPSESLVESITAPRDRQVLRVFKRHEGVIVVHEEKNDEYIKKTTEKSEEVRKMILSSIKKNVLFKECSSEELMDIVDAFESENFPSEAVVIKQGYLGDHFYVVENGSLDIFVRVADNDGAEDVRVGSPYVQGGSFGELALMYKTPRAATIRTREDCKLWKIDRKRLHDIMHHNQLEKNNASKEILKNVVIWGKHLIDILQPKDFKDLASFVDQVIFKKGHTIIREGQKGDIFYMIKSGTVDVFQKKNGSKPVAKLTHGQYFGERALMSEDIRNATCVASSDLVCLFLVREDFVRIFGGIEEIFISGHRMKSVSLTCASAKPVQWKLSDFDVMETLGMGAFGRVKLAKMKKTGESYALKLISKASIVKENLQEVVAREHECLGLLDHPFIVKSFGSVQDDKYIYLRTEVLLGGEFFTVLRQKHRLSEGTAQFYTASLIMAFGHMHEQNIVYRDLKPENLLLDSLGYVKIIDFGFAKQIDSKTYSFCGTIDYMAPEIITNKGHDTGVDYWALGIVLFEMITGDVPFKGPSPIELFSKIVEGYINNSEYFSADCFDLIQKLLKVSQKDRLGSIYGSVKTVMEHSWFSGFDWDCLLQKELCAPIKPKLKNTDDSSNFDRYLEDDSDVPDYPQWQPDFAAIEESPEKESIPFTENVNISPKNESHAKTLNSSRSELQKLFSMPELQKRSPKKKRNERKLQTNFTMPELQKQSSIMERSGRKKERFKQMTTAPIYREDYRPPRKRLASTFSWYKHFKNSSEQDKFLKSSKIFAKAMIGTGDINLELKPINILVMDGGGMKGYALLAMLEEFSSMCEGKDMFELFDLFGGTSVGGLFAMALGHSKTFKEGCQKGLSLANEVREKVFAKKNFTQLIKKGFLFEDKREEVFRKMFGERTSHVNHEDEGGVRSFAVCARRELSENHLEKKTIEPFLARSYEIPKESLDTEALPGTHKLPLYLSMSATSAAPGAFDRTVAKIAGKNYQLVDGCLVQNSPVTIAVREAKLLWPDRPIGNIISLGLSDEETESTRDALSMIKAKYTDMQFFRFMPPIDDFSASETNLKKIKYYMNMTKNYIRTSDEAKGAVEALLHTSSRKNDIFQYLI